MVDVDKQACHALAERGYCSGLWLESYVTWDFLDKYPRSMEPRYLHLNWNHIPGMYLRKYYLRTLVIEREEWAHLSDPASLTRYWEPTQVSKDFHQTFALVLCQTAFHDCEDTRRRKEFVVSVGVVWKPARYAAIPFAMGADEFQDNAEDSPTLLLVRLHWHSRLFPDLYFDRYHQHSTVMHDSGMPFNVSHPQRFVGALLHNAFLARDKPFPKAKLPPAFLDHPTKEYRDCTTNCEDLSSPDEHFMWLSNEFMPFQTDPGTPYVPLDFTLGLPAVGDWPKQTREVPWVLDPAKHPRPAIQSHHKSASPSSGDERRKRRKKKHCQPKKQELKVTTRGQGDDVPVWTHTGSNLSSSSESQTEGDSGIGSYQKPPGGTGSTTRHDHTPRYSLETVRKLDEGDLKDAPLSDHGGNNNGDQEMVIGDEGPKKLRGLTPYVQLDP